MAWRVPIILLISVWLATPAFALDLDTTTVHRDLAGAVTHLEDERGELSLEAALRRYYAGDFQPVTTPNIDFGFSYATHWLALPLRNLSAAAETRILSFNMRFMQTLEVYLRTEDSLEHVLSNGRTHGYDARPIRHRHLAAPITLPAGSESLLLIRYWSEGTTALPLSLESAVSFAELDGFHTAKNAAFYAFVGFMLVYAVLFGAATRSPVVGSYGFYLICVALYMVHMDGYAFAYLWPDWPVWNASAALPLGLALNVGAAVFTMFFLSTRTNYPAIHRLLQALIALCCAWALLGSWLAPSESKQLAFPFTFLCAFLFLGVGIRALVNRQRGALFFVIGWTGLTGAALFTSFTHWSAGDLVVGSSFEIIRIGVLIDASMMALAVLAQFNELRRLRNQAIMEQARAAEEVLAMQNRFFDLETRYREAFELAEDRSHQLAAASHDLRQPLTAMRMAMRGLSGDSSERQLMSDALAYLETLLNKYITSVTGPVATGPDTQSTPPDTEISLKESFPAQVVLDNVSAIFSRVAAEQGIRLRIVCSSLTLHSDPIALLRIVSNLVDNAIKHARATQVLVGFRRGGSGGRFIVMDNGVGLHHDAPGSGDGFGLGMNIIQKLCQQNQCEFAVHDNATAGLYAEIRLL